MARAKWGPAIGAEEKWRYGPGDIVKVDHGGIIPRCNVRGVPDLDDSGRFAASLCGDATCVVVSRMSSPPDAMFAFVSADGSPAAPDAKCKCYVVRVLPELSIQPANFFPANLGLCFIVKEKSVNQTNKERRMIELGIWNNESGVFDSQRLRELRNRVHEDDMKEKGVHSDDR